MAGYYPDVPEHRLPYDIDGTVLLTLNSSASSPTIRSDAEAKALNDEFVGNDENASGVPAGGYTVFVFPRLMDLAGIFSQQDWNGGEEQFGTITAQWSPDTTNGEDGTWTTLGTISHRDSLSKARMRDEITAVSATGVRGLRLKNSGNFVFHGVLHVYGKPSTGEDTERITLWDPALDQRMAPAHLDWGDVPRGEVVTRQVRVRNQSPTATAQGVTLDVETTYGAMGPAMDVSLDGTTWLDSVALGDLTPGQISPSIYVRLSLAADGAVGLGWGRVTPTFTGWA